MRRTCRPIAAEDVVTVDEDTPIAIDVLANDSDPEGQPLKLVWASASAHDATINATVSGACTSRPRPTGTARSR